MYIIQPLVPPVQENLVELLLMADAARGASAARVTAVMSHYAYARSDKKDAPRISIGGRLVADLLVTAGVNRVLTLTLHSPEVHGFFSVPVDHLHALRELAAHFRQRDLSRAVVLSPDLGYAKSAAAFARRLGVPVAAGAKERFSDEQGLDLRDHRRRGRPGRDHRRRRDRARHDGARAAVRAAASRSPGRSAWPARTACSPTARWRSSPPPRT